MNLIEEIQEHDNTNKNINVVLKHQHTHILNTQSLIFKNNKGNVS